MTDETSLPEPDRRQEQLVTAITEGGIWRTVWMLSWPNMISMFLSTAQIWINTIFVGRVLGKDALAAVMLGGQVLMIIFSLTMSITVGTTALVSRFTGARTHEDASEAAKQSMILAVILSIILTVPSLLATRPLLILMGATPVVARMGYVYTFICILSTLPFFLLLVAGAIYRGIGDMKTPLYIMGIFNAVNILGDWLLIYGPGPFPAMGVTGAAIALVTSRTIGTIVSLIWLLRSPISTCLHLPWKPNMDWFGRIMRIAFPALMQGLLFTIGATAFVWILGRLPNVTEAQAALSIGLRAEAIAYMPAFAFMAAATSLVGQNLGAKQPRRAEKLAWACTWQCVVVMSIMALIYYVFAEDLSRIFLRNKGAANAEVIALAVSYLRINAISEPFFAFGMVLTGAMQGAGDTKTPTIIAFVTMWVLRIPLGFLWAVTLHGGANAAWTMMCVTTVLRGVIMIGIFARGKWKTVQV